MYASHFLPQNNAQGFFRNVIVCRIMEEYKTRIFQQKNDIFVTLCHIVPKNGFFHSQYTWCILSRFVTWINLIIDNVSLEIQFWNLLRLNLFIWFKRLEHNKCIPESIDIPRLLSIVNTLTWFFLLLGR